ncbi:hypothetical protein QCA50_009777 [Cerrena zonata]|uniref:F-box domain-containing protein n=1 Tax=Cerrena zonata TaxID=2478898 RepID=A0AAW0G6Z2_9APHY
MDYNDLRLHLGSTEESRVGCSKSDWVRNIQDLPNELLASIFLHLHEMTTSEPGAYPWVTVCLVCRHWYEVAVNFSALWSKIPSVRQKGVTRIDHILLLVQRSRSSPLSIHVDLTARIDTMRELKDRQVFHRLVSASFWWGILPPFVQDEDYATMNAPQLRELNIYGSLHWPERPTIVPFSRGSMPLLTTLRIPQRHDPDQIASLCRRTVTDLDFCIGKMPISDLYSILSQMVNLEFLSLSGTTFNPQAHNLRLTLRHLRKLRIMGDITSIFHFLSLFDVKEKPRSIHISHRRIRDDWKGVTASLADKLASFCSNSIPALHFQHQDASSVEIRVWTTSRHANTTYDEAQVHVNLSYFGELGDEYLVKGFCDGLLARGSKPVYIRYTVGHQYQHQPELMFSVDDSFALFSGFTSAEYLELAFLSAHGFLQILLSIVEDIWVQVRSCFTGGSRIPHWAELAPTPTSYIKKYMDCHIDERPFLAFLPNLKKLVITGVNPNDVPLATRLLRDALETSSYYTGHTIVDLIVKP